MAFITKDYTQIAIKEEVTENVFPTITNDDFIEVKVDSAKFDQGRELIERQIQTGNRSNSQKRLGKQVTAGSVEVELAGSKTPGTAPKYALMLEAFGYKDFGLNANVTSAEGHTTTKIYIEDADISKFSEGTVVKVLEVGAFHRSAVIAVNTTPGAAYIELEIAMASAPADNVVLAKSVVYKLDKTANKTFSFLEAMEGGQEDRYTGCRTESFTLNTFEAGKIASMAFKLSALRFANIINISNYQPVQNNASANYVHGSCFFVNGNEVLVTVVGLSAEQVVSKIDSTCDKDGDFSSKATGQYKISCTFNPYKEQGNLGFLLNDEDYSIFFSIGNPTNLDGTESANDVAFYFPKMKSTKIEKADRNTVMTQGITAENNTANDTEQLVIAFF